MSEAKAQEEPSSAAQMDEKEQRIAEAAARALAEAAERRAADDAAADQPAELGGRDGPNPTRYGDWEKKGVAIDF